MSPAEIREMYLLAVGLPLLTFYLQVKVLGLEPELERSVREVLAAAARVLGLAPASTCSRRGNAWRCEPYDG